jgi:tetratricopeptide (TPR) repeat protein
MNSMAQKHFEIGKIKYFRFDREGAVVEFRESQKIEPNNPDVNGWLAITLAKLGEYDEATLILAEIEEGTSEYHIAKGIIHRDRDKEVSIAIDDFSKAIELNSNNEYANILRALCYSNIDKKQEALNDIDEAKSINPNAFVFMISSTIKSKFGDRDGALFDLNKAIELDPNNHQCWFFRANERKKLESLTMRYQII